MKCQHGLRRRTGQRTVTSQRKTSKDHSYFFLKQPRQSHGATLSGTPRADSSLARPGRALSQLTTTTATIGSLESLGNHQRDSFTIIIIIIIITHHHLFLEEGGTGFTTESPLDRGLHFGAGRSVGSGTARIPFLQGNHRVVILTVPTAGS